MKASYRKYSLNFKRPGGTSRGVLTEKETWFLYLEHQGSFGIGECAVFRGLSSDDSPRYEEQLQWVCERLAAGSEDLHASLARFPSIRFGLEQALLSLKADDPYILFPSEFTAGKGKIPINGLVWMGKKAYMARQVREKLAEGFRCIKLKIGALDFRTELDILRSIRKEYGPGEVEIRVDANGAFLPSEALEKLKRLSEFSIHSIEQPVRAGQWQVMAELCDKSPLPIALDEELIGVIDVTKKRELLQTIRPHFCILKPSLLGGYEACDEWIGLSQEHGAGWWITSALESNIGLNAIAQWTFGKDISMPQGLGTGGLFTNNFNCPLRARNGFLSYNPKKKWNYQLKSELCI